MRKVTQAELDKMQQGGAKVRKKIGSKPRAVKKAEPAPAPAPAPEKPLKEITALAESVDKATTEMAASTRETNRAILALQKKLTEQPAPKPASYKFTINRDSYGYIETVDAVPGGNK